MSAASVALPLLSGWALLSSAARGSPGPTQRRRTPRSSAPETSAGARADTPTAGPTRGHTARSARTPTRHSRQPPVSRRRDQHPRCAGGHRADPTLQPRAGDSAQSAPQQKPDVGPCPGRRGEGQRQLPCGETGRRRSGRRHPGGFTRRGDGARRPDPGPAATQTVTSLLETAQPAVAPKLSVTQAAVARPSRSPAALTNVANHITTVVINSVVSQLVSTFSGHSPFVPQANSPLNWLVLAASRRQPPRRRRTASAVSIPGDADAGAQRLQRGGGLHRDHRRLHRPLGVLAGPAEHATGPAGFQARRPEHRCRGRRLQRPVTTGDPTSSAPITSRCWSPPMTAPTWGPAPARPAGGLGDLRLHPRFGRRSYSSMPTRPGTRSR